MKTLIFTFSFMMLAFSTSVSAAGDSVRCGSGILSEGDSTLLTKSRMKKCGGKIIDKEIIKSDTADAPKRESWFVKIYANCHIIEFIDGSLDSIEKENCY